jgi:hypothetical protein
MIIMCMPVQYHLLKNPVGKKQDDMTYIMLILPH